MLKSSVRYGLFLFAGLTLWQLIVHREVEWGMVVAVSVLAGFFNLLWDWAKVPYDWNKRSGD
ncbi:hypothetical protein C772_02396 [Bhargavaea cecembensis DSE10]|uniref:Uncharacterized protein n=1 Tax=Bhargavaea cecembensis DSE10 TaxID=1235279 RepID=M7NEF7_9BACL|nr:hypothetical protein [Bhargavaea cecembensis]EMR05576.1 hypothetical protein C772_02396 [Bhargavaea cecembensis DSE10]